VERFYDNNEGYSDPNLISSINFRVKELVRRVLEESPEYSALELTGFIVGAVNATFYEVSIERRLGS